MVAVAFLDHVFGPNPVESHQDRTLGIYYMEMWTADRNGGWNGTTGYRFLDRNTRNLPNIEKMSMFTEHQQVVSYKNGEKLRSYLKRTDGEFWEILTFRFLEEGPLTVQDEKNRNFVAVINEATREKFFGHESAVGKTIEADGQNFRIVGVVENVPYLRPVPFADIWVPISTLKNDAYRNEMMGNFQSIYLARSESDFQAIRDEFKSRLNRIEFPDPKAWNSMTGQLDTYFEALSRELVGFRDDGMRERVSRPGRLLAAMAIIAILFMLLPTVNLININVSRILERASEIGVRKAFGASSGTLVGQFVIENVLLTLIGGAAGFLLSRLVLNFITSSGWFPYAEFNLNIRIFLGGLALAILFGLLSGVYPAWRMSRLHPVQALKGGMR